METILQRKINNIYKKSIICKYNEMIKNPFYISRSSHIINIKNIKLLPVLHAIPNDRSEYYTFFGNIDIKLIEVWIQNNSKEKLSLKHKLYLNNLLKTLDYPKISIYTYLENNGNLVDNGIIEYIYQTKLNNIEFECPDWSWYSASKIKNAVMNDHLVDYLELYRINNINDKPNKFRTRSKPCLDEFTKYIMNRGQDYEQLIIDNIKDRFFDKFITIGSALDARNKDFFIKTLKAMKDGVPFIYQPVLWNGINKTLGCSDLIVRSDYLHYIIEERLLEDDDLKRGCIFSSKYHYRVIDIKSSTLQLTNDKKYILNSGWFRYYKAQLLIYNMALGEMQGVQPERAYLLGKSKEDIYNIGIVDYDKNDNIYYNIVDNALKWLSDLSNNKHWTINPPSDSRLLPNISCNINSQYKNLKHELSNKSEEITQLWQVGYQQRNNAISNGIWKLSDKRLNSKILGIKNTKYSRIIDSMILMYQRKNSNIISKKTYDTPWTNQIIKFYIDIETVNGTLYDLDNDNHIFMIGLGWYENNIWNYKCIKAKELTKEEEIRILNEMMSFINNKTYNIKNIIDEISTIIKLDLSDLYNVNIYHWGLFERVTLKPKMEKYEIKHDNLIFNDMCKWMIDNEIVFKDSLNYSIKTVGKALEKNGAISLKWPNKIDDGLNAMHLAWKEYNNSISTNIIDEIEEYNMIDCKMMAEIHNVLRKNID